jgi:hypothetical protein
MSGKGLSSIARVTRDGRVAISLNLTKPLPDLPKGMAHDVQEFAIDKEEWRDVPKMNIVIMIVGSRGMYLVLAPTSLKLTI